MGSNFSGGQKMPLLEEGREADPPREAKAGAESKNNYLGQVKGNGQ
jgi:hypothetical protein